MLDKLKAIADRYEELERVMSDPAVASDYNRIAELAQERSDIEPLVQVFRDLEKTVDDLASSRMMLEEEEDAEMQQMVQEE
ncbi:MAG: PCRF domain-containing protein, partial [Chloroflexota bacterium]